jgi:hypothetical protein
VPKPVSTKSPATPVVASVSSQPSSLSKSIQQTLNAAQAFLDLLYQIKSGGSVDLCVTLMRQYNNIHAAPIYSTQGQPAQLRQAYDLYRQAINTIDERAGTYRSCGQAGGTLGQLDAGVTNKTLQTAIGLLIQAVDLTKSVPEGAVSSPVEAGVTRLRVALLGLRSVFNSLHIETNYGSILKAKNPECSQVLALDASIQPLTMDASQQPQSVHSAYDLYQQALTLYQQNIKGLANACVTEDGTVSVNAMRLMLLVFKQIDDLLTSADNSLHP